MKKGYFFFMAAIAITVTSCRKDLVSNDFQASQSERGTASATASEAPVTKLSLSKASTNYGALISASSSSDPYGFTNSIAAKLGLSCIRDRTIVPGNKKVKMLTSSYNVLLNFSSSGSMPMKFRTDITAYKNDLENTVASLNSMPAVAIIENEESNKNYFTGSASEYLSQLKAAIAVMHAHGIAVTNGGITSTGLKYLTWQDYMNRGMKAQADDYKMRMHVAINSADTKDRANFISTLIASYATMDIDYVNFHWRSQTPGDAQGLGETIDYLKRASGKPVITTEIGQYDKEPVTLTSTVQMCKNYRLPFVIWYSNEADRRSFPLQYSNELLTATGFAYQAFIASN